MHKRIITGWVAAAAAVVLAGPSHASLVCSINDVGGSSECDGAFALPYDPGPSSDQLNLFDLTFNRLLSLDENDAVDDQMSGTFGDATLTITFDPIAGTGGGAGPGTGGGTGSGAGDGDDDDDWEGDDGEGNDWEGDGGDGNDWEGDEVVNRSTGTWEVTSENDWSAADRVYAFVLHSDQSSSAFLMDSTSFDFGQWDTGSLFGEDHSPDPDLAFWSVYVANITSPQPVPLPASGLLLLGGLGAAAAVAHRRRRKG